jgi:hypothetical protein
MGTNARTLAVDEVTWTLRSLIISTAILMLYFLMIGAMYMMDLFLEFDVFTPIGIKAAQYDTVMMHFMIMGIYIHLIGITAFLFTLSKLKKYFSYENKSFIATGVILIIVALATIFVYFTLSFYVSTTFEVDADVADKVELFFYAMYLCMPFLMLSITLLLFGVALYNERNTPGFNGGFLLITPMLMTAAAITFTVFACIITANDWGGNPTTQAVQDGLNITRVIYFGLGFISTIELLVHTIMLDRYEIASYVAK